MIQYMHTMRLVVAETWAGRQPLNKLRLRQRARGSRRIAIVYEENDGIKLINHNISGN